MKLRASVTFFHAIFAVILLGLITIPAAQADQALIVAVDQYPGLTDAGLDNAAVNSAPLIKQALIARNFPNKNIIVLLNADATQAKVLGALDHVARTISQGERFVFYFLGHGGNTLDVPVLLPYDATMASGSPDITKPALSKRLNAVAEKGGQVTVLLDSCFAAGLIQSSTSKEAEMSQRG